MLELESRPGIQRAVHSAVVDCVCLQQVLEMSTVVHGEQQASKTIDLALTKATGDNKLHHLLTSHTIAHQATALGVRGTGICWTAGRGDDVLVAFVDRLHAFPQRFHARCATHPVQIESAWHQPRGLRWKVYSLHGLETVVLVDRQGLGGLVDALLGVLDDIWRNLYQRTFHIDGLPRVSSIPLPCVI